MVGTHFQISSRLKNKLRPRRKRLSFVLSNVDASWVSGTVERVQLEDDSPGRLSHAPPSSAPFSLEDSSSAWLVGMLYKLQIPQIPVSFQPRGQEDTWIRSTGGRIVEEPPRKAALTFLPLQSVVTQPRWSFQNLNELLASLCSQSSCSSLLNQS